MAKVRNKQTQNEMLHEVRTKVSIDEILPGLFIGNELSARSWATFEKYGIEVVINATPDVPNTFEKVCQTGPVGRRNGSRGRSRSMGRSGSRSGSKKKKGKKQNRWDVEYIRVDIDDSLKPQDIAKMTKQLPGIVEYLYKKHTLEGKTVLVHCHAGMQRSAIIVAGYLVKKCGMKPMEAIRYIISKRPIAFLGGDSLNFMQSLRVYYKGLQRPYG